MINEWLMTETKTGDGFTIIEKQPSNISDLLKDVGIKLYKDSRIKDMIHFFGETGNFLYYDSMRHETKINKYYLINTKKRCIDSILFRSRNISPILIRRTPSTIWNNELIICS